MALWPNFCVVRCSRTDLSMLLASRLENRPKSPRAGMSLIHETMHLLLNNVGKSASAPPVNMWCQS